VFRVPETLPDDVAVLTEIFAVTHSLERAAQLPSPAGFRPGASVAVIGVGALGLAHAVKAALMGAGRVIAVDPSRRRLELATRLAGAEAAVADEVRAMCAGEGVDVVVNATGFPGSFAQAVEMVRDGGLVIEVGAFVDMGDEPFNPAVLCGRNLTLLGIGGEDLLVYESTLALLARHHTSIPLADMVSHRFAVEDAPEAMETALDADRSAKVLITSAR
jgi:L-iditol 2-dehydrogenase